MTICIYGPETDPTDAERALDEMEELGASTVVIAVWNGDAVLASEYDLGQTEAILRQMADVLRMQGAH